MNNMPFELLPGHLKTYIRKFSWSDDEINEWLLQPIPALGGRSITQALADGALTDVNNAILRVGDALGVEGYFD
jgi:hypothetical protein